MTRGPRVHVARECMQMDQHMYSHSSCITRLKTTVQHKFQSLHSAFVELDSFLEDSSLVSDVWVLIYKNVKDRNQRPWEVKQLCELMA